MITADTITDEQIRELRDVYMRRHRATRMPIPPHHGLIVDTCDIALGLAIRLPSTGLLQRPEARARCAEILNRRSK